jgi:hypothetical protein
MPPSTWNAPGQPARPAEARRAIEEALVAARTRDRQLRDEIARAVTQRVEAARDLEAAGAESSEARTLAGRALARADDAAKEGQRADAARWTDAARVFAMRWRDADARVEARRAQLVVLDEQRQRAEAGIAANAGALRQAAAVRMAGLSGRRLGKLAATVDEAVAAIGAPATDLVARAEQAARAARDAAPVAPDGGPVPAPVPTLGVLEDEVDMESVDPLLDELRAELGLVDERRSGTAGPRPAPSRGPGSRPDRAKRAAPASRR